MSELTRFLLARVSDDEARFHEAAEAEAESCRNDGMPNTTRTEVEAYWLRREDGKAVTQWPRWLAECEAKRRIVEDCQFVLAGVDDADNPRRRFAEGVLRKMAWPYSDHPDYPQG